MADLRLNDSLNETIPADDFPWTKYVLIPLNTFVILTGVIGNGIVVTIGIKMKQWRQVNHCYVTNLAVTDILFLLICVTFTTAIYVLPHDSAILTDSTCKFMLGMGRVTLEATCLTLGAMAFDRYLSVVHSVRSKPYRTPLYASIISLGIWLVSFALTAPFFIWSEFSPTQGCSEGTMSPAWSQGLTAGWVAVSYVLPLLSVVFCYTSIIHFIRQQTGRFRSTDNSKHRQHRVTKLTVILTLLFAICWLPVHIINLWLRLAPETFPFTESMYIIKIMSHWLSYANSCVNPIVYAFYNDKFRENCRVLFGCGQPTADSSLTRPGDCQKDATATTANDNLPHRQHSLRMEEMTEHSPMLTAEPSVEIAGHNGQPIETSAKS